MLLFYLITVVLFIKEVSCASIVLKPQPIQLVPIPPPTNQLVNSNLINRAYRLLDGGDFGTYVTYGLAVNEDLAGVAPNLALGQLLTSLGELALGRPGDTCNYANLITQYVNWVKGGNNGAALRKSIDGYVTSVHRAIDQISLLAANSDNIIYGVPYKGTCAGGGRKYPFEDAWDIYIKNAGSNYLINDAFCSTKRQFESWNKRANSISAATTVSTTAPARAIINGAQKSIVDFLNAALKSTNPYIEAVAAKNAIAQSAAKVKAGY